MTASQPTKKLVLVVEDDQYISESLVELLEIEGYETQVAGNGQQAIDILRAAERLPNLILLDLMMPIKDGFAFREEQLADPRLSSIPVVVMSADGHVQEKLRRIQAGAYVRKPLDIDEFIRVIGRF